MLGIIGGLMLGASLGIIVGWLTAQRCGWVTSPAVTKILDERPPMRSVDQWSEK